MILLSNEIMTLKGGVRLITQSKTKNFTLIAFLGLESNLVKLKLTIFSI